MKSRTKNQIPHKCKLFMSGITGKLISQGVLEKYDIRSAVGDLRGGEG